MEESETISKYSDGLKVDLDKLIRKWGRMHKTYLVLHLSLVFAAIVLSGAVIPFAAYYRLEGRMEGTAFVSGLVVALIIGIQNAFATGSRWTFYSGVFADLQALDLRLRRSTFGNDQEKVMKELEEISTRLQEVNTRAYVQVPRGQGAEAAGRAESVLTVGKHDQIRS